MNWKIKQGVYLPGIICVAGPIDKINDLRSLIRASCVAAGDYYLFRLSSVHPLETGTGCFSLCLGPHQAASTTASFRERVLNLMSGFNPQIINFEA